MANDNTGTHSNVTETLASFASKVAYEDIPPDVVHQSKRLILDTIGCTLGGYSTDRALVARNFVSSLGGNPQATVLGSGEKTSITSAAYVNGNMANILDNDETLFNFAHPAAPAVIGALTMAEREKATGRELIKAVAVGYDIAARIGLATESYEDRPVGGFGWKTFGAASAAGIILRQTPEEMASTFGLAGMFCPSPSVNHILFGGGDNYEGYPQRMNKYYDSGWTTQGGVTAAAMSQVGYTGPRRILDGEKGFFRIDGYETADFPFMVKELGDRWWIRDASYKRWPLCRHGNHALTGFDNLVNKHKFKAEEIEKVFVKGRAVSFFTQDEQKITPELNIPYCMSMLMFDIMPGPRWYSQLNNLDEPRMKEFRAKVTGEPDDATVKILQQANNGPTPARPTKTPTTVQITARGKTFSERVEYAKGDPWTPESIMDDQELSEKFRENALDIAEDSQNWKAKVNEAIDMTLELQEVENVCDLTQLLHP